MPVRPAARTHVAQPGGFFRLNLRAALLKPSKLRTTITFRPEGVGRCRLVCLKEDDFLYKNFASDYNLDGTFRVVSGCNG